VSVGQLGGMAGILSSLGLGY